MFGEIRRVLLKSNEVIKRIDFGQVAGMDYAHEQIPELGTVFGLLKQSIFPMQYGFFQGPFADVIVKGRISYPQKGRQRLPVLEHVCNCLAES